MIITYHHGVICQNHIHNNPNKTILLTWERDNVLIKDSILVSSTLTPYGDSIGIIGIEPTFLNEKQGIVGSFKHGFLYR